MHNPFTTLSLYHMCIYRGPKYHLLAHTTLTLSHVQDSFRTHDLTITGNGEPLPKHPSQLTVVLFSHRLLSYSSYLFRFQIPAETMLEIIK